MMLFTRPDPRARSKRRKWLLAVAFIAAVSVAVAGIITAGGAAAARSNKPKLIIATMSFPCALNDYSHALCAGFQKVSKELPKGYRFELKTGLNFSDTVAYNNLIRTSIQLHPAGLVVFPNGPAGEVPVLKAACAAGIKIIVIDSPVTGLGKCETELIDSNNMQLGEVAGKWLLAHPPANTSKQVAIVNFPPGEDVSTDQRATGFTNAIKAGGYTVAATVSASLTLNATRTAVTNMLTAHPDVAAVFSTVGSIGDGAAQALQGNPNIVQLTFDVEKSFVQDVILGGKPAVDVGQAPRWLGVTSVLNMVKATKGNKIPKTLTEPSQVVDKTNAQAFLKTGGL